MQNFWEKLPKPFFVLAPLANVTDAAFRLVIAKYGKPDVLWTEFVSADGLFLGNQELLKRDLEFSESERPIVAQFFSARPEMMEKAAHLAQELGFDGVDINMGCPDRSVEKQGAGAKLILSPELARELIEAAKRGAPKLPVSVKTRLGYNKDILDEWLPEILKANPAAVTIHARTRKEMSKVPARWERVKRAVEIRNECGSSALIIGNGDVKNINDAKEKVAASGADGAMLGRAIFGNPWLFAGEEKVPKENSLAREALPRRENRGLFRQEAFSSPAVNTFSKAFPLEAFKLLVAVEHSKLFEQLLGDIKNFAIMKKHFKAYVEGFPGAKELRVQLMETKNAQEVENIIKDFLSMPYTESYE